MQRVDQPVMTTGLERIAAKAREDRKLKFTSLAHHVTEELLWESVNHIPNTSATGSDRQTVQEAKENFKQWVPEMLRAIHDRGYQPPPILRVFIPKPGKKEKRPLGIPCVTDRARSTNRTFCLVRLAVGQDWVRIMRWRPWVKYSRGYRP
jgi:RNA-directed DNA polymerase